MADMQSRAGQFDAALAGYRQVLSVQRGNPSAVRGMVNVLSQTGQADEALRLLDGLSLAEQAEIGGGLVCARCAPPRRANSPNSAAICGVRRQAMVRPSGRSG